MKYLANISLDDLKQLTAPSPDPNCLEWKPVNVPEDSLGPDNCNNWQSPEVVNIFGARWAEVIKKNTDDRSFPMLSVAEDITQFVRSVHPDRRKALSPEALTLTCLYNGRPGRNLGAAPIRDWALGLQDDKPSSESVGSILTLAQKMDELTRSHVGTTTSVLTQVAAARRVSYLLGEPLKVAGAAAMNVSEVVYLVFQHYFGNDPEAWVVALDLATNWEDSLEELALTAAAACGLDIPEEVIDLADLEAAAEDESAVDSTEEEPASEQPEEAETSADEESDPVEEPQEDSSDEEPAAEESAEDTEEGDATEDETSDEEVSDEEDIVPLDITTPVAFTLF